MNPIIVTPDNYESTIIDQIDNDIEHQEIHDLLSEQETGDIFVPGKGELNEELFDVLVFFDNPNGIELLEEISGIHLIEKYNSFYHLRIGTEQSEMILSRGFALQRLDNLNELWFGQSKIDTATVKTDIADRFNPTWLGKSSIDSSFDNGYRYYIVQFKGPVKDDWLRALERNGAVLLDTPINYYGHIIQVRDDRTTKIKELEFIKFFNEYIPPLKLRGGLEFDLDTISKSTAPIDIELIFFKTLTKERFFEILNSIERFGGRINQLELENRWWLSAKLTVPKNQLVEISKINGLKYIHPYGSRELRNDNAKWVIQSFNASSRSTSIWDRGLHGEGIVVGMADTGIDFDHIVFRHNSTSSGTPGPSHRKLVRYNTSYNDYDYEGNVDSGHGTHTAASIIGDSLITQDSYDKYDGMAYAAKMAFYDIVKSSNTWDDQYITVYFNEAYEAGARLHSDSWGDNTDIYTSRSERCDQYQWDNYDFLIFIAPGNGGRILEPATAKNVVGVGNALNGDSKALSGNSGKGPTLEGMISPTIIAPGSSVYSADSDGIKDSFNDKYIQMSGTSMSTPIAAGAAALVEQYFRDGFYPSGTKTSGAEFMPSGPLKKAVLVNSGADMYGGSNINSHIPDNSQGWGKIVLEDTLHFSGDKRELWIEDRYNTSSTKQGLQTGDKAEYLFNINSGEPFEITVVWNDFPGAGLKNNLDLIVTDPDDNKYLGNVYGNGESKTGGSADDKNPIESVYFKNPKQGYYQLSIYGTNIGSGGRQNFSLVATGDFNDAGKGKIMLNSSKYGINASAGITVFDSNHAGFGFTTASITSTLETTAEIVTLNENPSVPGKFEGSIILVSGQVKSDGKLQVKDKDTITALYSDQNPIFISEATAIVDSAPPLISGLEILKTDTDSIVVFWETDEPSTTEIRYGTSTILLDDFKVNNDHVLEHTIEITDLNSETPYFFEVVSEDTIRNRAVDNKGGSFYKALTASYELIPQALNVGWLEEGENYNHFDDGRIYTGVKNNKLRIGAVHYNLSSLPDDLKIYSMQLYAHGGDGSGFTPSGGSFKVDWLDGAVDSHFDGTKNNPVYDQINSASAISTFEPDPLKLVPSSMRENSWYSFEFNNDNRTELEEIISKNGEISLRFSGPTTKTGTDNIYSWDTGYNKANGSGGENFAPHLVFWAEKAPRINKNAPDLVLMKEDSEEPLTINLTNIFISPQPLEYKIPSHYSETGRKFIGRNLDVVLLQDDRIEIATRKNWNGQELISVNGSVKVQSHSSMENIPDMTRNYVVYNFTVYVQPVNDPPTITGFNGTSVSDPMEITINQSQLFSSKLEFSDVDLLIEGDSHKFVSNNSLIAFTDIDSNEVSFTAENSDVGVHTVELRVEDLAGESDNITVRFIIKNINDPPVPIISEPRNVTGYNTSYPINFDGSASYDPDEHYGDKLSYEWLSDIDGIIGTQAIISVYLQNDGEHLITLRVIDSEGLFNAVAVTIRVDRTPGFYEDDIDKDGLPNDWELEYGLNIYDSLDRDDDPDGDTLTNYDEFLLGTNPLKEDSDGDKFTDGEEVSKNTDPNDPDSYPGKKDAEAKSRIVFVVALIFVIIIALVIFFFLRYRSLMGDLDETAKEIEDVEYLGMPLKEEPERKKLHPRTGAPIKSGPSTMVKRKRLPPPVKPKEIKSLPMKRGMEMGTGQKQLPESSLKLKEKKADKK